MNQNCRLTGEKTYALILSYKEHQKQLIYYKDYFVIMICQLKIIRDLYNNRGYDEETFLIN